MREDIVTLGTRIIAGQFAAITALVMLAACGGSPGGPSSTGGGGTVTSGATITIANGAVSPVQVTISVGQSVTIVNNDTKTHDMASDPHPIHTDCPALNGGILAVGQTKATSALTTARTCGYHDHNDPDNANLKGSVVVR
jgi:plastocyanin